MANFTIGRIRIVNFKIFDDLKIQFNNKAVTVLDGPNGFGKTTVFDAIELAIRGKINRIEKLGNIQANTKNTKDNYLRDPGKPCFIFIELLDNSRQFNFVIGVKRLSAADRASEFGGFKRAILDSWIESNQELESIIFPEDQSTIQSELQEKIGSEKDLERFFNLFHYVQQEEPAFFLKQTEANRAHAISGLFDTLTEVRELDAIEKKNGNRQ